MSYNPQNPNGQAIMTNSSPVVLASDHSDIKITLDGETIGITSSALPTGAATSANQSTIIGHIDGIEGLLTTIDADTSNISTKIDTLAGAVSGTEFQVDVLTMPTITVQATDLDIRDLVFATDKVDVSGSTGVGVTGTFWQATQPVSIASLPSLAAGSNNIGDVDVLTVPSDPFGANADAASATGSISAKLKFIASTGIPITGTVTVGTHAVTQSGTWILGANSGVDIGDVTINNASGGSAVNIQDGGNSITVDGTVAATQSGTWNIGTLTSITNAVAVTDNSSSLTVDAPVGTPVFVRLSDGAAAITTLPVSLASVPSHAVTNTGTFVVQENGAALTSLQLIDDPVVVLGTATYTEASSKGNVIAAVRRDADTTLVDTTNEFGPLQMDANGRLKVEAFSGETLPVSLTSTTITGTVAVTKSGTWDITNAGTFAVQAAQSGNWSVRAQDGSGNALTSAARGSERALSVQLVDGSGTQITTFGGGTEYTEDAVAAADPTGGTILMTRDDQLSTVTEVEGDWSRLRGTSKGALWVAIADSAGDPITSFGGGTQYTEDVAAAADPVGNMMMAVRLDTLGAITTTDGDNIALRATNKGEVYVKHVDAIPITDNAGSLTVDGTVAFSNTTIAVTNAGTFVTQENGAALTSLQLIDDVIYTDDTSTHATGTTKGTGIMAVANPTDAAVDANDIGMVAMTLARALKNDITTIAGTAPTTAGFIDIKGADGNIFVRQATASNLNMTEASAASILTSVQLIDDTVVAQGTALGTTKVSLIGGSVTTNAPTFTTGQINQLSLTTGGGLRVSLADTAANTTAGLISVKFDQTTVGTTNAVSLAQLGANTVATGNGASSTGVLRVAQVNDGTGVLATVNNVATIGTSVTPGTGATNLGKAEDAAHTTGDVGVMMLAVRSATASDKSANAADGDYEPLLVDANGRLHIVASAGIAGDVASGSADSGNPVKIGFQARTTNPTAVTDGQRVTGIADKLGRQVTVLNQVRDLKVDQTTTITASTTETTVLTAVASTFLDVVMITIANTSATDTRVDFRDSTGGSVRFSLLAKAGQTTGFVTPDPINQTTVNTNWTAQCGTSVTDVRIYVKAVKNI